jgi:hypothetical protein
MTERLLQYIWQFQYFNRNDLETTNGETLDILQPGKFNTHQGPDFLEARIKIEENIWVGNIELHVNACDWHRHAHANDPNYRNVILHVVWNDDDEHPVHNIPTLSLADRVPKLLLQQYLQWMKSDSLFPCGPHLGQVEGIVWTAWKERILIERMQRKAQAVLLMLEENKGDWEETCWWVLARNYGLPVNADAFEEIARSVSYHVLLQRSDNLKEIENLLFEKAACISQSLHSLRMRPAAFPKVRLKQLAELIYKRERLFSLVLNTRTLKHLKSVFADNVIINSVVPLLSAYGYFYQQEEYIQKAINLMNYLSAEQNSITRRFKQSGVENKNAADSQALIELKTQYCDKRRCLDCAIGNTILKRNKSYGG